MEKLKSFIKKFMTKEVILYVVFGILTTIVNFATFYLLTHYTNTNENVANSIAIILAVLFAYLTNRKMVFNSTASTPKEVLIEIFKFIIARSFTMLVEFFGCMLLFYLAEKNNITKIFYFKADDVIKAAVTVIVIIINFFLSKFFAFKNNKKGE